MRFLISVIFCLALMVSFVNASPALKQEATVIAVSADTDQPAVINLAEAPILSAKAYAIYSMETGELIVGHNTDKILPIASVTKLFTAATVLQSEKINNVIEINADDIATEGRAGKLEVGQKYQARELLFPLLLESSNDAASALERNYGPITLADTNLADASGLSSYNQASTVTLAREVRNLYKDVPHLFDITTLSQYVGESTVWVNNSPVKHLPGYKGGKHGYTTAADNTLVAIFSEPTQNNQSFIYVLLGSNDLKADTESLRATFK